MESSETWRTEALKSFAVSRSGTQGVKMSGQGVRTGWRRKSMIRTTCPDRICYHPDGVDPDSLAHSVSSERGVPTPCTRRRSPLRSIAHSNRGGILSDRLSTFSGYFTSRIPSADISYPEFRAPTFYIRIFHSRIGEEDASTSPDRHIRIPW